jgi:AcrR family transcriptional regulator
MECEPCTPKGRPREFCVEQALASALRVFWEKGYEGASLSDLTEAMGITRPSLYAAFGNKEALFRKALDLYEREKLAYVAKAMDEPTARRVAEHLLTGALENFAGDAEPKGCFSVISSVACGAEAESVRTDVIARAETSHRALIERFQRAKNEGDLPDHVDVSGLTGFLIALLQGLSVQSRSGASRAELTATVETASPCGRAADRAPDYLYLLV